MKKPLLCLVAALAVACPALARDTTHHLDIADVMAPSYSQGKLDGSVRFYFAGQDAPATVEDLGEAITSRKTNAAGKSDVEACRWVMLSALMALQAQAKARGANAVVGITSFFNRQPWSSPSQYECHAGGLLAGVALKGSYVRVADR